MGLPNQRTRTQNLAVMTISLTDIAADGWATGVHQITKGSKTLFESDKYLIISSVY